MWTEVKEIRAMVEDLLHRTRQARPPQVPADLMEYYTRLIGHDVGEELVNQLLDRVARGMQNRGAAHWDDHGQPTGDIAVSSRWIREELQQAVVEMLPPAEPLVLSAAKGPTVVAVVGPTGVGKTTTIAKLAANMKLREGKRVGLITIDTYRIAAVEQLKTYSEILQVPLVAVTAPEEMQPVIRRMSDLDLILIDTAGRSQKDELRIAELRRFLTAAKPDQVHLVLSCTSREETIHEAIRSFSVLDVGHLIFTKLDEAVGLGVILNVLRSVDLRLSYITNGQSVPADIEVGGARRVAQLILGADSESAPKPPVPAGAPVEPSSRRACPAHPGAAAEEGD
jgi:flagellar biosynthesis protein FlhF